MYWNLDTEMKCPKCGKTTLWNLQTHFMGDLGSFGHPYKLGEKIQALGNMTILLDGKINDFTGDCDKCGRFFDVGAEIVDGIVIRVWVLNEMIPITIAKDINKTTFKA
ncbi:MAG: hypothetical protein Q7R49_01445 [Candidatus Daviesbacteria bacterium]|nr:hypothetical protein [Candidatus Daviesbacteria bacterium]